MKTTFKLLSIICFVAICVTSCSVVEPLNNNHVNIRFKNVASQNLEDFNVYNQSLGTLNQGETTEYIQINFNDGEFVNTDITASIESVLYSKDLSLMMTEPDLGYCGVGLEDKIMLEKGGDFTFEVYVDKNNPNTLKFGIIWE